MREDGGFELIKKAILNLSLRHDLHISAYGEGNERRLTGKHETASIDTFSWVWMEHLSLSFANPLNIIYYRLLMNHFHLSGRGEPWLLYPCGERYRGQRKRYVLAIYAEITYTFI
jgi:hypothetical protein